MIHPQSPHFDIPNSIGEFPHHFTIEDINERGISSHGGVYFFAEKIEQQETQQVKYIIGRFGESDNFSKTLSLMAEEEKEKGSAIFCHLECHPTDTKRILSDLANAVA